MALHILAAKDLPSRYLTAIGLSSTSRPATPIRTFGVPSDADLRTAFDLDSLDFLNLIVRLDARTGGTTAEVDYPKLTTLAGWSAFLGDRLTGSAERTRQDL